MPGRTKSSEPSVTFIPNKTAQNTSEEQWHPKRPRLLTVLFSILALIAVVHFIAVAHQSEVVVTPNTCTGLLQNTDYTKQVHLQPQTQNMGAVQIVDQLDGGQPAALVTVTNGDAKHSLDVYIYGCALQQNTPHLNVLFTQRSLPEGIVSLSSSNTLVIGQLDTNLTAQAAVLAQPLQQNIYREYQWFHGTFVQAIFPSLYPVTSRSEAEALQQQVNNGQTLPWSDPLATAEQMAKDLFKWPASNHQDNMLDNNGTTAHVKLMQQDPALQVTVTLERLVQHTNKGLWFVTAATSTEITLAQPQTGAAITSPATVQGAGALADGQLTATLFDHTLTSLTLLNNPTLTVDTSGAYTGSLFYTNNAHNQPGLLLIQSIPPPGSTEAGKLVLIKVILN
jgi:hypothetical protein